MSGIFSEYLSQETLEKLRIYETLLEKWQKTINLVSNTTMAELWKRHFCDSLQLLPYLPGGPQKLIDMGSGAGFPGLVLAIARPDLEVTLIESDRRKSLFLQTVSSATEVSTHILCERIENLTEDHADILTARALAPLENLLRYGAPLLKPKGSCFFLKGKNVEKEIEFAEQTWSFSLELFPSLTDSGGKILKISELRRHHYHE